MPSSGIINGADSAACCAVLIAAGAAIVAGNTLRDLAKSVGVLAGSTGVLAGTAIGLSYIPSTIAAKLQWPIKREGHEIGNRLIAMAVSVFALTALAVRYSNNKFSPHQMTLAGALFYATISAINSIITVSGVSKEVFKEDDVMDYTEKTWKWHSTSDAEKFWAELEKEERPEGYVAKKMKSRLLGQPEAKHFAHYIEDRVGEEQTLDFLNRCLSGSDADPANIAAIFLELTVYSKCKEEAQHEMRKNLSSKIRRCLPATDREIQEFWNKPDATAGRIGKRFPLLNFGPVVAENYARCIEHYGKKNQISNIFADLYRTNRIKMYSGRAAQKLAQIFMQLSAEAQAKCGENLPPEIKIFLPPTVADSTEFWKDFKPNHDTATAWLEKKFLHGQEQIETTEGLAFFIENYQHGEAVSTVLNGLVHTCKWKAAKVARIFKNLSAKAQAKNRNHLLSEIKSLLSSTENLSEVHPTSRHSRASSFSWSESATMGFYAGLKSGFDSALVYLAARSLRAFGKAFPDVKRSIPAVLIMAPTFALAEYALSKEEYGLSQKQKWLYPMLAAAALGTVLTPKLSSFMLKKRIGYLASAGYALAPIVGLSLRNVSRNPSDFFFGHNSA